MAPTADELPLISIVVPSFNQGHFLPDTFESIFRQHYPHLEVVVIDGGSTDSSVEIIRRYSPKIKFWRSERDGGQSAAINEGMRHCSGDVVAWLNSDDYYWDDSLWTVGKAYARHPGRGLYLGNGLRYDQRSSVYIPFNARHMALDREALTYGADFILQPSTFFLRRAWQEVGGLDEQLRFCMDWDIFIRIAARHPCVLINEFLGVSREYEETKTRSGKMDRAFEIVRMVRRHTNEEASPGSMLYLLETLAGLGEQAGVSEKVATCLRATTQEIVSGLCARHGRGLWFPARTDAQDEVYLPIAARWQTPPVAENIAPLPSVSVVITGANEDAFARTSTSVQYQAYAAVETVAAGEGAAGAAEGLRRAKGDVLVWMEAGDLLADGALRAVGRAFASDPKLDLLYGNALHLDDQDNLFLADHGPIDSAFWSGELPTSPASPDYHIRLYKAPRSAVYFRRRLWEQCGGPDDTLRHRYADAELFRRYAAAGNSRKLQRTLALCRVNAAGYTGDRQRMFSDLYRFERPHWPRPWHPAYRRVVRRFLGDYMRWKFAGESNRKLYWLAASLAALSAVTGIGNPMRWWPARDLQAGTRWENFKAGAAARAANAAA
jgi:glycosyltransferase involved in cell wall biosynthesis